MRFVSYEIASGAILSVGVASSEEAALVQADDETGVILDVDASFDEYVVGGAINPRPLLPVSQVGNTLTVPSGTEFSVRGSVSLDGVAEDGVAEDGVLEFEFAEPGTYTVVLRLFPYLDAEVTLES